MNTYDDFLGAIISRVTVFGLSVPIWGNRFLFVTKDDLYGLGEVVVKIENLGGGEGFHLSLTIKADTDPITFTGKIVSDLTEKSDSYYSFRRQDAALVNAGVWDQTNNIVFDPYPEGFEDALIRGKLCQDPWISSVLYTSGKKVSQ